MRKVVVVERGPVLETSLEKQQLPAVPLPPEKLPSEENGRPAGRYLHLLP
jgi:hypothetical protein